MELQIRTLDFTPNERENTMKHKTIQADIQTQLEGYIFT